MRVRIEINRPDLFLGLVVLGVSAGYLHAASQVPESLLADVVGAGGVPTALGWAMAALGVILCARGLLTRAPAEVAATPSAEDDETSAGLRREQQQVLGHHRFLWAFGAPGKRVPLRCRPGNGRRP